MSILPEAAKAYIGMSTEGQLAPEAIEPGAVRRNQFVIWLEFRWDSRWLYFMLTWVYTLRS